MKKLITLILVVSMLVTVFASCAPNDEISGANSSENSVTSETETSPSDVSDSKDKIETSTSTVSGTESESDTSSETDTTSENERVLLDHEKYNPSIRHPLWQQEWSRDYKHITEFFYTDLLDKFGFYEAFNISDKSRQKFSELYGYTQATNIGFILEYYQISKDEYIDFLDKFVDVSNVDMIDKEYPLLRYVNGWYGENYMEDKRMFNLYHESKGETYYAEKRDGKHNSIYYTIDYRLIEYVGIVNFNKYLKEIDDVNVLSFIDYFDIDAYTFSGIVGKDTGNYALPYKTYYVYANEDLREAYFGFATNKTSVDTTLFYPNAYPEEPNVQALGDGVHDPRYFIISDDLLAKALGKKIENTNNFYQSNEFTRLYYTTEEWNYGFLIEYFGITEEQWRKWVDELGENKDQNDYGLRWQFDLWFRSKYQESLLTLSVKGEFPEVRTYYGDRIDETYNSIYYKIDRKLIMKVGVDNFEKFLKKYEGTKDCNIMKFMKEFNLTENDFEELYSPYLDENRGKSVPYNIEAMFDEPDAYFKTAK